MTLAAVVQGRRRELVAPGIDVQATLQPLGVYGRDPTHRWGSNWFAKAVLTPAGSGTMRLAWDRAGRVTAEAWGSGADWLVDRAPHWIGLHDDPNGFEAGHNSRLGEIARRHAGIRLAAGGVVWQELLFTIVGQRVTTQSARRSWAGIVRAWGEPAPGRLGLRLPPAPVVLAHRSYVELHRFGVERRRADAIIAAARRADRLEEAASMDAAGALARLTAIPGLGLWTATSVVGPCTGDADTIVLRDYGLPTMVNYAFTGDARRVPAEDGGDELMCRHLEPWSGHRRRVVRLLLAAGISAPARGPRARNPDITRL